MAKKKEAGVGRQWLYDLMEKPVGSLYLLYGEEGFRRDAAVGILKKRLIDPAFSDFNLIRLEGASLEAPVLAAALNRPPMMAGRTLILVRDLDVYGSSWLIPLLEDIPEYACLVFVYDTLECRPDARTKLHAALKKHGEIANFTPAPPDELIAWIRSRAKGLGVRMGTEEARVLIENCGSSMYTLSGEIDKLCIFSGSAVSARDILDVTCAVPEAQVFRMCDLLSAGDGRGALACLYDIEAAQPKNAIPTLALIGRQMRNLYTARLVLDSGGRESEIAELCRFTMSFQTSSAVRAARRLRTENLRTALRLCAEADLALKSSRGEPYDLLTELVLRLLCLLHRGAAA